MITASGEGTVVYEAYQAYQPSKDELAALTGVYYSSELEKSVELIVPGNTLVVDTADNRIPLGPMIRDVFALPRARMVLSMDRAEDGAVSGFRLNAGGVRGLVFERNEE